MRFIDFGIISTMQNIQSDYADAFFSWNWQNRVRSCNIFENASMVSTTFPGSTILCLCYKRFSKKIFDSKIIFQQLLTWAWSDSGFLYTELRMVSLYQCDSVVGLCLLNGRKIFFESNIFFEKSLQHKHRIVLTGNVVETMIAFSEKEE